jgi:hypothetical protein
MEPPLRPYKGLNPFGPADSNIFFGRDADIEIICANLAVSRLTVLYGPTGVGKTSVLQAGVAKRLRALAGEDGPDHEHTVVVLRSWTDNPLLALHAAIQEAVTEARGQQQFEPILPPNPPDRSLTQCLEEWIAQLDGDLLIILDQFEEYFSYVPFGETELTFGSQFARAINRSRLRANFLVAIREDALARLDRFKGRIPNLFDNYLRIEGLDRKSAKDAIKEPIRTLTDALSAGEPPYEIEPKLVDAVLDQLADEQALLGEGGRGAIDPEGRIEASYLQLVMERLWEEETARRSRKLRRKTLDDLHGVSEIVTSHLNNALDGLSGKEQRVTAAVLPYLVTRSRTKVAHTVLDLCQPEFTGRHPSEVAPVLEKLAAEPVRILRKQTSFQSGADPRFEISHDVLAPALLDWRRRYLERMQQARAEQTRGLIAVGIAFLVMLGLLFVIFRLLTTSSEQVLQVAASATDVAATATVRNVQAEAASTQAALNAATAEVVSTKAALNEATAQVVSTKAASSAAEVLTRTALAAQIQLLVQATTSARAPTQTPAPATLPSQTPVPARSPSAVPVGEGTPSPTATLRPAAAAGPATVNIGSSVLKQPLAAVRLGGGPLRVGVIGSLHGGQEFAAFDYLMRAVPRLSANDAELVPRGLTIFVLPTLNPDDLDQARGFNANGVDLNRNFPVLWVSTTCGSPFGRYSAFGGCKADGGGTASFSEPEAQAARELIEGQNLQAVLILNSGLNTLSSRNGGGGLGEPLAKELQKQFGIPYVAECCRDYPVTGQLVDWAELTGRLSVEINATDRLLEGNDFKLIRAALEFLAASDVVR